MINQPYTSLIKTTGKASRFIFTCILCIITLKGLAQDKTKNIGNKLRKGSTNNSFNIVKGAQVGIKMNAGGKTVQLLKLSFDVDNLAKDTIAFKVNVYTTGDKGPLDNLVKDEIKGTVIRNNQVTGEVINQLISVDLAPYDVRVKGKILVSVEFLNTNPNASLGFSCGLLNGGTWYKRSPEQEWKKMPVVGADFNVLVKKLK
ncbi:hypothetical protein [Mucilaginibacter sp. SP1R1]|uniref:hypothetical protein n=1 Tax=Mucilaginibacter sp. SP1R1 TaxID=2723091 RepID=UPI0016211D30|nr:hypothetical protein [Mucilaginibacter sp. SP1R1]MBB6151408.1 hypothetical protein [Mucilaginibacter sp. SP1R1]